MKAITRKQFGGPEMLEVVEVVAPTVQPGTVMIEVRAFGLNRAELYMRGGEWGNVAEISGIECVGRVIADATNRLSPGQTVMALMGGMGRTINGSYADYTVVPASNVIPIETSAPWEVLAALPETYATAWTCLHRNLELKAGQRLLVRGGTSSLGQAAIDLAVQLGAEVIATTRSAERTPLLHGLGAQHVVTADGALVDALTPIGRKVDAVLDLIGNSTIVDSMRATRRGGRVCLAGFLGGLAPVVDFNPLSQMPSGVHLSFFGSFNFGSDDFSLSDIPMQQIVNLAAEGKLRVHPSRIFTFSEVAHAHQLMERNEAQGKFVVLT
ncbi:zinc-binding dehydrogenase [Glaciimonas sp. GS1]|uniref:Zinc-binding dehydrogenase n=2 Tax=Glaciimonas soli TaxID=2590999 RepID=A0A843YPB7_9BURK|nr:zinc-binding dehydrogenase [Glaciimonas soli]